MYTYITLGTNRPLHEAARFYDAVLAPLGLARCATAEPANAGDTAGDMVGWGTYEDDGASELALGLCHPFNGQPANAGNGTMIAFKAATWAAVEAFHAAALAQGGASEGAPDLRPQYGPDFYAAYVRDPDGHKLAAVCRGLTVPID